MPFLNRLPQLEVCCGCVTDLKVAAAIIAVLGIVTSPLISWAVVRHMYVIKVSCVITTSATQPDVVDINMNNALSFGFGVSGGLGASCLSQNASNSTSGSKKNSGFVKFVRYIGWVVLVADGIFVASSVNFLINMFRGMEKKAAFTFIVTGLISVLFGFIYGLLYVSACVFVGGLFPVFEFVFACFDLIIWTYYLMVVYSFRRKAQP